MIIEQSNHATLFHINDRNSCTSVSLAANCDLYQFIRKFEKTFVVIRIIYHDTTHINCYLFISLTFYKLKKESNYLFLFESAFRYSCLLIFKDQFPG